MIIMSEFCCILGIVILLLFKEIHIAKGCITQQFSSGNEIVVLNCSIESFSGTGSWSVDGGGPKTNCGPGSFCTITVEGNYTFTSDTNGIYATINPFSADEIGKLWKCENAPSFNCTITVSAPPASEVTTEGSTEGVTSTTTTQSNTTLKPTQSCGFNGCIWVFLAIGLLVVILICLCCYMNKKRSKDRGRRPENGENVTFSSKTAEQTEKNAHKF